MSANRVAGSFVVMLCIALAVGQVGCIPQQANTPPTADAGADQTVNTGDTVTLTGSGTDPDGDTLTYAWIQTVGTAVTLTGQNTATLSFTAPSTAGILSFNMTVTDGNGGSDTDAVVVTVQTGGTPPPTTTTPQLFIANSGGGDNVVSYENPATIDGDVAPDTNLAGISTQLTGPSGVVVNAADELMVLSTTPTVTSYANAPATNGNLAPDGNLSGPSTLLAGPTALALNAAGDVLFVANAGTNQIFVYDLAGGTLNGNLAPPRIIGTAAGVLDTPRGLCVDPNGDLYVANGGGNNVLVFANAENLNGTVAATRTITSGAFVNIWDVFVDGSDNLFVVDPGATGVHSFAGAAALNGSPAPTTTLTVPGVTFLAAIVVDSNDVGYIADVDPGSNAIYSYDNISTLNGNLTPDRTIAGGNTQLDAPRALFLIE
jgi:hypothetical protein